jgi:hypothetical protein
VPFVLASKKIKSVNKCVSKYEIFPPISGFNMLPLIASCSCRLLKVVQIRNEIKTKREIKEGSSPLLNTL